MRRFLLGLYNSSAWPFELSRLRNLDRAIQNDVLTVVQLDWNREKEVHKYVSGGVLWSEWAKQEREYESQREEC